MGNQRYWVGVCYTENMVEDWQERIGDILCLPFAYCIHDKDHLAEYKPKNDLDEDFERISERKTHVHIIIAFPNTTTYNNALRVFQGLSVPGYKCINTCKPIINVRNMYEYLIHNTETAKKQKKWQYSPKERIEGNNFDIGAFEQISQEEKYNMVKEIGISIRKEGFTNFSDLWDYAISNYDAQQFGVFISYKGIFAEICKGNFLKTKDKQYKNDEDYVE